MEYNMGPGRYNRELEQRYIDAEQKAKAVIDAMNEHPLPSREEFTESIHTYVRTRMLLEPEDELVDSLNVLGQMNLARALGVSVPELSKMDMEAKCGGTSAVMTKKILLIMALNKNLGVRVTPEEAADITKLSELVDRLYELYVESRS